MQAFGQAGIAARQQVVKGGVNHIPCVGRQGRVIQAAEREQKSVGHGRPVVGKVAPFSL